MLEFVETLFTSEITIALIHPLIHPLLFFFHFSSWNAQLGHGPKISIFHNLVSEKASSTLTAHTVESFPATFCSKPRPSLDRGAGICRSRPKIADSRVHLGPRKHSDTLPRDPIGPLVLIFSDG